MSFDTSGNFTRSPNGATNWQTDAAAGTRIRADLHDNHDQDIANGLSECLNRNGKGGALADISMQGFKITNLQDGVNPTDAVNKRQVEAIKSFTTGIIISGADANGRITFTGLGETGLSWNDMFFGVDVANQWWIWNDKGDATGNNVLEADKLGRLTQLYKADGPAGGPIHELYRDKVSTSGGVNGDTIGVVSFTGKDSTNAKTTYATIYSSIEKADNNLEGGAIVLSRMVDGTLTPALATIKEGVSIPQNLKVTGISRLLGSVEYTADAGWRYYTSGGIHYQQYDGGGHYWSYNTSTGILNYVSGGVETVRFDNAGPAHFYRGATFDDAGAYQALYDSTNLYLTFAGGYYWAYNKSNGVLSYTANGTGIMNMSPSGAATFYYRAVFNNGALFDGYQHYIGPGGGGQVHMYNSAWYWDWAAATGNLTWITPYGLLFQITATAGNLFIAGPQASKQTAGQWVANSDGRLKNIKAAYTRGLAEIMALPPARHFSFRKTPDVEHISYIAQDVEGVFPECITRVEGDIDGAQVSDLRQFDPTNLLYAALNAIKELGGRLEAAEARIAALEAV